MNTTLNNSFDKNVKLITSLLSATNSNKIKWLVLSNELGSKIFNKNVEYEAYYSEINTNKIILSCKYYYDSFRGITEEDYAFSFLDNYDKVIYELAEKDFAYKGKALIELFKMVKRKVAKIDEKIDQITDILGEDINDF